MATPTSISPSTSPFSPDAIMSLVDTALRTELAFILIASIFGSLIFAMLLALFTFSSAALRRKPIFILNAFALLFGVAYAILSMSIDTPFSQFNLATSPTMYLQPRLVIVYACFNSQIPIILDSILLLRLVAVFPRHSMSPLKFHAIMALPVLMKIGRITNGVVYIVWLANKLETGTGDISATISKIVAPGVQPAWFLALFDNMYTSIAFLIKLYGGSIGGIRRAHMNKTVAQNIFALFWIASFNFVFPVLFNVALLVLYGDTTRYTAAACVEEVTVYANIIGVVFATVWATGNRWAGEHLAVGDEESIGGFPSLCVAAATQRLAREEPREQIQVALSSHTSWSEPETCGERVVGVDDEKKEAQTKGKGPEQTGSGLDLPIYSSFNSIGSAARLAFPL
ncbi:hypothetical protein OF83DRAFT_1169970 [Amylostereum chailletii]|nr:hypothetical protein OF83DRAFT_1169970 [Amylostereum chailletii]